MDTPLLDVAPFRSAQRVGIPRLTRPLAADTPSTWSNLVGIPWERATTGWQVLADFDTPVENASWVYGPLRIAGQTYERGLATYPFSEIDYALDGRAQRFTAWVGVTDDSVRGAGSVRFRVFGDEFLLHDSGLVAAGSPAQPIDVGLAGLRTLRLLVDDAGDGSLGDYALWADPRLLVADAAAAAPGPDPLADERRAQTAAAVAGRAADADALQALGDRHRQLVQRVTPTGGAAFDPGTASFVLANDELTVALGAGGIQSGRLQVQRRDGTAPTLANVSPGVTLTTGTSYRLHDLRPDRVQGSDVRPATGGGGQIEARYLLPDGGQIEVQLTVPAHGPTLDLRIRGVDVGLRSVDYLDAQDGATLLGDGVAYLTDRSHLYLGTAHPDGQRRRAPLEATKPAVLWSEASGEGLLLTLADYVPSPAWLTIQRFPGRLDTAVGLQLEALLGDFGPNHTNPPTLTLQLTRGPLGHETFAAFRQASDARYPALPFPTSARYQWGSWYAYGPGVSAAGLQRQLGLLASNFLDLGPWLFAIDAGWYVQYGRADAELTTVDREKFPNGVRGVADAAHALGMNVILYLGTGFVHDGTGDGGEWLALRGFIDKYPQWLLPFQCPDGVAYVPGVNDDACLSPSGVRRYLMDYRNPEVQAYLADIIRTFFVEHGADGILLDGVADAEGQLIPRSERDTPSGPRHPLLPTLELYQFIRQEAAKHRPGAFMESGWLHPTASDPYVDVFWYGDDLGEADAAYPFAGFFQRLDYALFSHLALGQRAYLGTGSGDPTVRHARWRIQAAAALGAHATISYDLGLMAPATVGAFRADLVALDPFQGTTTFGPGVLPDTFATTRDGTTYLGIVNRAREPRTITVPSLAHGLVGSYTAFTADDGTGRLVDGDFEVELPARTFRLLVLRREPGVLWTDSVAKPSCGAPLPACTGSLEVTASGPPSVPGFMSLATPPPTSVTLDGVAIPPGTSGATGSYRYDAAAGVLSLTYAHTSAGRRIAVRW